MDNQTTVNIQISVFNFKSLKVLAGTKLPQRSDDSTIPADHTSLFPPPKIYIHLAAHNALLCNPPTGLYYTETFPKSLNFELMGGNFSLNFVDDYVLKTTVFLNFFFQLLRFRFVRQAIHIVLLVLLVLPSRESSNFMRCG